MQFICPLRHCITRKRESEGSDPTSLEFSDYDHTATPKFTTTFVSVDDSIMIRSLENAGTKITEMTVSVRDNAHLSKRKVI